MMFNPKKLFKALNIVGSLSIAFTIPWIIIKVCKAIYLKRCYNQLLGKVVVITGASSGLGEALAHEFYRQGCQVVLCARRRQELERVRSDLLKMHCVVHPHPPIINPLDLSDINTLPNHIKKILDTTGHIDILINNGGISYRGTILTTKPDVDIKVMLVNYFGAVALTKAALPSMLKRKSGHIVYISSVQGLIALPERSAYGASKHALQAFGDTLRAEVAHANISVTMVSPGYISTQLSCNALTDTGSTYGQMDETTMNGYRPEYVAEEICKAVVQRKNEIVVATFMPRIALFLRKFLPSVYFYVMERRANKNRTDLS